MKKSYFLLFCCIAVNFIVARAQPVTTLNSTSRVYTPGTGGVPAQLTVTFSQDQVWNQPQNGFWGNGNNNSNRGATFNTPKFNKQIFDARLTYRKDGTNGGGTFNLSASTNGTVTSTNAKVRYDQLTNSGGSQTLGIVSTNNTTNNFNILNDWNASGNLPDITGQVTAIPASNKYIIVDYFNGPAGAAKQTGFSKVQVYFVPYAPGGVIDASYTTFTLQPQFWVRADTAFTPSNWLDFSGVDANAVQVTVGNQPSQTNNAINFNPAINFNGTSLMGTESIDQGNINNAIVKTSSFVPSNLKVSANNTFTIITVLKPANVSTNQIYLGSNNGTATPATRDYAFGLNSSGQQSFTVTGVGSISGSTALTTTLPYIIGVNRTAASTYQFYQNGIADGAAQTFASGSLTSNNAVMGGQGTVASANGLVAEQIVYSPAITGTDLQRVNAYLAAKNGITMNAPYLSSGVVTYYDPTGADATYNKDITVIGKDAVSGLNKNQSVSATAVLNAATTGIPVYVGSANTIGSTNAGRYNISTDQTYLAFGNDGGSKAFSVVVNPAFGKLMGRVWKVHSIKNGVANQIGSVKVAVPTSYFSSACNALVVNASDNTFASGNTLAAAGNPVTINGTSCYTYNINFTDGAYFSFAENLISSTAFALANNATTVASLAENCLDANGYAAFNDNTASANKLMAFKSNGNTGYNLTLTASENTVTLAAQPSAQTTDGLNTSALWGRMYTITDANAGTYLTGGGVTVRLYYKTSDSTNARTRLDGAVSGVGSVETGKWFKFEGDAAAVMAAQSPTGFSSGTFTYLTPSARGTENSLNYVEFNNITGFSTFGFMSAVTQFILPITLVSFTATNTGNELAILNWATATETNSKAYEVQASTNGVNFETVQIVPSKNSSAGAIYQTKAALKSSITYFRLKIVDIDGAYTYSTAVVIKDGSDLVTVYPNPVKAGSQLQVKYQSNSAGSIAQLSNSMGQVVLIQKLVTGMNYLPTKNLSRGIYMLRIVNDNKKSIFNQKIILN
jgi:hypothetical protein